MAVFYIEWSRHEGYFFEMKSNSGEIIITSEYNRDVSFIYRRTRSVYSNRLDDLHYQRINTSDGSWYFVFKDACEEVIGVSELYNNVDAMEKAIQAVKRAGKTTKVVLNFI